MCLLVWGGFLGFGFAVCCGIGLMLWVYWWVVCFVVCGGFCGFGGGFCFGWWVCDWCLEVVGLPAMLLLCEFGAV